MNSYKTSIFLIKILSFFVPVKRYRKKFRIFLNKVLKVDYNKNLSAQNYLKKYIHIVHQENVIKSINSIDLPIWQLWFQGREAAPAIVRRCLDSVQKYSGGRQVKVLTHDNIQEYVDIPEYIWDKKEKGIISNTHFSDILRICLLERHGGTWVDATVLLTGEIPEDIVKQDFFAFSVPKNHPNYDFHLFSSWFIHAQPNNVFLKSFKKALFEYWKHEDKLIDYFTLHLMIFNIIHADKYFLDKWNMSYHKDNIEAHEMQWVLNDKYNEELLDMVKKRTSIHKLTYKIKSADSESLFNHICKFGI